MRKRLEELNWRMQPTFLVHGDHAEVAEVFGTNPAEGVASPPVAGEAQQPNETV